MKNKSIVMAFALLTLTATSGVMAEPKFVSDINGSSFVINAFNTGSQAYECTYVYTYNQPNSATPTQQASGTVYIQAGANNTAVISRNTNQLITKLNFDYKCVEK